MDPIYYESGLISLICVEKISIYKARSAVKRGRKCEKETEIWRDSGSERENKGKKEHKEGEREGGEEEGGTECIEISLLPRWLLKL